MGLFPLIVLSIGFIVYVNSFSIKTTKNNFDTYRNIVAGKCNDNHYNAVTQVVKGVLMSLIVLPSLFTLSLPSYGDDELAKFAAEGNKVNVDASCFMKKCALETSACTNNINCLKGLSCLAKCQGGSMCSTGCFAKYGNEELDNILYCSVEKNDCVEVPGKSNLGWVDDKLVDLPSTPVEKFETAELEGTWYKIMGLDSRYDCFDCQQNTFKRKNNGALGMEAYFRIPKPTGYSQNKIVEELNVMDKNTETSTDKNVLATLRSEGRMFGLTFWENWYLLGTSKPYENILIPPAFAGNSNNDAELKLIFYTGHTLQGSYKGSFVYSRKAEITPDILLRSKNLISSVGLDPNSFCIIRNQCFDKSQSLTSSKSNRNEDDAPFWYLGQRFFKDTEIIAKELADWFEDPELLSEWLVSQQQRMVLQQPLEVSPFASNGLFTGEGKK